MKPATALIACALGVITATAALAETDIDLTEMVRTLNAAQNRIVRGDEGARSAATKQFERIEQALPSISPEDWALTKTSRAAAIYLLAGGSPRALRKLLDANTIPTENIPLISGTLAYAEGKKGEAGKLLMPIEAKALPSILAGHIALVQGGLSIGVDNAKASALFDLARLVMPGSLIEEAALRREITTVDAEKTPEKYLLLGQRYADQYTASPFSKNFWEEYASTVIKIAPSLDDAKLGKFEDLFVKINSAQKNEIPLTIARKALLAAQLPRATSQIARAEPLADTPQLRTRIKMYNSILKTMTGSFEEGGRELQAIDQGALARTDVELLKIVSGAITRLDPAKPSGAPHVAHVPAIPGPPENDVQQVEDSALVKATQQALIETDALLKKAHRE